MLENLGNIGEFVGSLAVLITLVYLAKQIRQNTESLGLASELELSAQVVAWHRSVTQDPDLCRIWDTAVDPDAMSEEDNRRFRWLVAELFFLYEGHYEFYAKGHVSEKSWQPKMAALLGILQNPIAADWWDKRQAPLTEEFREYLESLRGSTDASWTHQAIGSAPSEPS
jgi:hypothetical protein